LLEPNAKEPGGYPGPLSCGVMQGLKSQVKGMIEASDRLPPCLTGTCRAKWPPASAEVDKSASNSALIY